MAYMTPITREELRRQTEEAKEMFILTMRTRVLKHIIEGVDQAVKNASFEYIHNTSELSILQYTVETQSTPNKTINWLMKILHEKYVGCDISIDGMTGLRIRWG